MGGYPFRFRRTLAERRTQATNSVTGGFFGGLATAPARLFDVFQLLHQRLFDLGQPAGIGEVRDRGRMMDGVAQQFAEGMVGRRIAGSRFARLLFVVSGLGWRRFGATGSRSGQARTAS